VYGLKHQKRRSAAWTILLDWMGFPVGTGGADGARERDFRAGAPRSFRS